MITTTMTLCGIRLSYEAIPVTVHAWKQRPGVVVLGGSWFTDNSTRVSAGRSRLE